MELYYKAFGVGSCKVAYYRAYFKPVIGWKSSVTKMVVTGSGKCNACNLGATTTAMTEVGEEAQVDGVHVGDRVAKRVENSSKTMI